MQSHPLVGESLRVMIESTPGLEWVGEAAGVDAPRAIARLRPDLVVLDTELAGADALGMCRDLSSRDPVIRCLVLVGMNGGSAITDAVEAGAAGIVLKTEPGDSVRRALEAVAAGGSHFSTEVADAILARVRSGGAPRPLPKLHPGERRVLDELLTGASNPEISRRLGIKEQTVKNHLSAIYAKLGVTSRLEAIVRVGELDARGEGWAHY